VNAAQTTVVFLSVLLGLAGCKPSSPPSVKQEGPSQPAPARNAIEVVFTYGSEKEEWIKAATDAFHRQHPKTASGKEIRIRPVPMGSGECIDTLLNGSVKAHLTSPASGAFIKLGNAKSRTEKGGDLIGPTENLVLSPVVIAMWKPMAEALGWPSKPVGWAEVLLLARDPKGWAAFGHPEWGRFRFGHTNPEFSNSGLISLFAEVYAASGKTSGLTLQDVTAPATARFLTEIESSVVHYGSSTGFFGKKMFNTGPDYLSAAVLYENMVIESYQPKYKMPFPVVAIYPKEGTFWSDHPAGVVQREWVTPEHAEAAKKYIDFLLERPQQERAMDFGFRPASVEVALKVPIDVEHGVDPKEPQTTLEVPSVDVMDATLRLWEQNKKPSRVTLVFDVSGSMKEEDRITFARQGAQELLAALQDRDTFALMPFNNQILNRAAPEPLGPRRKVLDGQIRSLFAGGGTALYDAILAAYQEQSASSVPGRISAVVVLTDGQDTNSTTALPDLLRQIRANPEREAIRVFTIGYGAGAEKKVLQQISETTQAKSYEGKPENIREVFKDISTFF